MSTDPSTAKSIFLQAVEKFEPDQWSAFLAEACGEDAELRREVEFLLESHSRAGEFLQHGAVAPGATVDLPVPRKVGTKIGPYKLLQRLGDGGMGEVYLAEQTEPVDRRVAVKIIKAGMDTRQVIARFEAERQALAMMDHPNIAKVFDAGTTESGQPYFVMELVKGLPITEYCDGHRLEPRKRLELFRQVCQGVQHAHQKGIIHRDLKPSNVLVAEYDDVAVPKIIDFGVAKAIQQRLTDKTMFTEIGTVVGTIEYMSPEQAKLNQLDIDTRSDLYSLGVLLYELLTGATPFDREKLRSAALDEMLRIIREEEPSRPSIKISTSESLASTAANRHVEPKKLGILLRGELDWIVMKALEKERSRRYDTANAFAEDITHYLNDEAVVACPPSAAYRLQKFARRNKPAIATAAAIGLALIIGTGVASWQAIRVTQERNRLVIAEGEIRKINRNLEAEKYRAQQAASAAEQKSRESLWSAYVANIRLMKQALDDGDLWRLQELVLRSEPKEGEPDYRGWEWSYLAGQVRSTYEPIPGGYSAISVNPVADQFAAARKNANSAEILIRDTNTRETLHRFTSIETVSSLRFSRDGRKLAVGADSGEITIYDLLSDPDDVETDGPRRFEVAEASVSVMEWSPDDNSMAYGTTNGQIEILSLTNGKPRRLREADGNRCRAISWNPVKGRLAASVYGKQTSQAIYDTSSGRLLSQSWQTGFAVAWSPNGEVLAVGDRGAVLLFRNGLRKQRSRPGFTPPQVIKEHEGLVNHVAWINDTSFVSCGADKKVNVYDLRTEKCVSSVTTLGIAEMQLERSAKKAFARASSGRVQRFSIYRTPEYRVQQISARSLNARHGVPEHLNGRDPFVEGFMTWTADGRYVGVDTNLIRFLDRYRESLVGTPVETNPTRKMIATISKGQDYGFRIYDPDGNQLYGQSSYATPAWGLGEQVLFLGNWDGIIVARHAGDFRKIRTIKGHERAVVDVAVSPDGRRLATVSNDRTCRIWDTATGDELVVLTSGTSPVESVAWSPDGSQLATWSNGEIHIWGEPTPHAQRQYDSLETGEIASAIDDFEPKPTKLQDNHWKQKHAALLKLLESFNRATADVRSTFAEQLIDSHRDGVTPSQNRRNLIKALVYQIDQGTSVEIRDWLVALLADLVQRHAAADPSDVTAWQDYTEAYFAIGQSSEDPEDRKRYFQKALKGVNETIHLDAKDTRALRKRAAIQSELGRDPELARRDRLAALEADFRQDFGDTSRFPSQYFKYRGQLMLDHNHPLEALDDFAIVAKQGWGEDRPKRFEHFDLTGANLSRVQIEKLSLLPIDKLSITGNSLETEDFESLSKIDGLRDLKIYDARVTASSMKSLHRTKRLRKLMFPGGQIVEGSLRELVGLADLSLLDLTGSDVTNDQLADISNLANLAHLKLNDTSIGDDAIETLRQFSNLRILELRSSKATAEGITRLKSSLPGCRILWEPPKIPTDSE